MEANTVENAWNTEPFGNDVAVAWVEELLGSSDYSLLEHAFDIPEGSERYEMPYQQTACAALAVTAMLVDPEPEAVSEVPGGLTDWVEEHSPASGELPEDLLNAAIEAGEHLLTPNAVMLSEWEDEEEQEAWVKGIRSLLGVLED